MMASRILIRRSLLSPTLITASPKRMALRSLQTMAAFDIDQYRTDSPPPALQSTAPHPNIVNKSIPTNVSTSTSPSLSLIDDTVRQTSRPHEDWTMSHPVYTRQELDSVKVVRREAKTVADRVAILLVRTARWGFDFVTRYKHDSPEAALATLKREGKEHLPLEELRRQGYVITVDSWLRRILFLEAVAGVPGMVAAVARHLRSLRLMQRDNGWIATLLSEAENERMHLLSFLAIKKPTKFFRFLVLVSQGVFFNAFFLAYLVSPKAAHRFVATLEEEACLTYTQLLHEMKIGNLPEWTDPNGQQVPTIAKDYWRLPANATMEQFISSVRMDEAGHRFLNHTLANMDINVDVNPFAIKHPNPIDCGTKVGFERAESLEWNKRVREEFDSKLIKQQMKA